VWKCDAVDGTCNTAAEWELADAWAINGTDLYYNSGNVGVGTTAPVGKLHVVGTGNVGIGTTVPTEELHLVGELKLEGGTNNCEITIDADGTCDAGTSLGVDNSIAVCAVCTSN
jgi:hypothetical protein